jgi:hypothetical protein
MGWVAFDLMDEIKVMLVMRPLNSHTLVAAKLGFRRGATMETEAVMAKADSANSTWFLQPKLRRH